MASLNQVTLIGYLGDDPKVRQVQNDRKVANISIATTERGYTAKDGTVYPDKTEWHNVVLWGKLAEVTEKFLKKGAQVFIQGSLHTHSYEDKEGVKKYSTEINADVMQMLDRKPDAPAVPTQTAPTPATKNDDIPF